MRFFVHSSQELTDIVKNILDITDVDEVSCYNE